MHSGLLLIWIPLDWNWEKCHSGCMEESVRSGMYLYCHLNTSVSGWSLCLNFMLCNFLSLDQIPHLPIAKPIADPSWSCCSKKVEENKGGEKSCSNMQDLSLPVILPNRLRCIYQPICKMQRARIFIYQKNLHSASCWEIQDFNERSGKDCSRLVKSSMELQDWSYEEVPDPEPDARLQEKLFKGNLCISGLWCV